MILIGDNKIRKSKSYICKYILFLYKYIECISTSAVSNNQSYKRDRERGNGKITVAFN
jgi:hypothetical protein